MVFPTVFDLSLNLAIGVYDMSHSQFLVLLCWLYRAYLSLAARNIANLILVLTIIFLTSTMFGLRPNKRKGTQPLPSTENWIKVLLSKKKKQKTSFTEKGPAHQNKTQFVPQSSLSHQETTISLLSFSVRGQTDWKPENHNHRKLNNLSTLTTVLSNSMKL